jgi:hypothetical protein
MADLVDTSVFDPVPEIEAGQLVKGGPGGPINLPLQALVNRTAYLRDQIDQLVRNGLHVIGTLTDQAALDLVNTQPLSSGDGYFVGGALALWNGQEWVISGSLIGPPGAAVDSVSIQPNNNLSIGGDGKLYVPNDISIDLLSQYNLAKE